MNEEAYSSKKSGPVKSQGEGMALLAPLPCFIPSSLSGTIHNKNIVRKMDITDLVIIDEAAQALEASCWIR